MKAIIGNFGSTYFQPIVKKSNIFFELDNIGYNDQLVSLNYQKEKQLTLSSFISLSTNRSTVNNLIM